MASDAQALSEMLKAQVAAINTQFKSGYHQGYQDGFKDGIAEAQRILQEAMGRPVHVP
jgi:flagellar biosynthesis/type III secretory pathway protein FliH